MAFQTFKVQLSRFLDRPLAKQLGKVRRRYLGRVGGAIRKTAKRLLKPAKEMTLSEMPPEARAQFWYEVSRWRKGQRKSEPMLPDRVAPRGRPPLLHTHLIKRDARGKTVFNKTGKVKTFNPLKDLILFSLDDAGTSVVIGPSQFHSGNLQRLEKNNPFMEPAFAAIEPQFPQFLAAASGKN